MARLVRHYWVLVRKAATATRPSPHKTYALGSGTRAAEIAEAPSATVILRPSLLPRRLETVVPVFVVTIATSQTLPSSSKWN